MTGPKHLRGSRPRLARLRQVRAGGRVATAAVAVAVVAGGCAAVPTSGAVQQLGGAVQAGVGNSGAHSQSIPVPPGPGWSAEQIVEGFLAASASFAHRHAVAREYLDPHAQRSWQPGWAVTVVSSMTAAPAYPTRRQIASGQPSANTTVLVKGLRVATLTNTGQSASATPAKPTASFSFSLRQINGQWRITNPPPYLLLNQDDFQNVYQPRNIYFLAGSGQTLVPDPVFVPQQDTNADLATGLVDALLQAPAGWLQGAATTGFPRNSGLLNLKINGPNAIVDLGGKAATASRWQQKQMAAQLAWTLASGSSAIQSVELEISGRPLQIAGSQLQLLDAYSGWMPAPSAGSSLYYIGSGGTVKALSGVGPPGSGQLGTVTLVTGAASTPSVPPLRSIAVSPDGRWIAGISTTGKAVYAWDLAHKAAPVRAWPSSSGPGTSLSWDQQGDLWITAGGSVWLLPPGKESAVEVFPAGDSVTSFQVAPDGVRAVMINGSQLQLVAINRSVSPSLGPTVTIGSGITDPESLSWYDANNVIVLDGSSSGGQLYEVPLNGGAPRALGASEGNIVSVTATNPSGATPSLAVGLANEQIMVSSILGGAFQNTHATGQAPAFPG